MENVKLLRQALACIWTELEKDNFSIDDCQTIATEALDLTQTHEGKVPGNETGLEAWREITKKLN